MSLNYIGMCTTSINNLLVEYRLAWTKHRSCEGRQNGCAITGPNWWLGWHDTSTCTTAVRFPIAIKHLTSFGTWNDVLLRLEKKALAPPFFCNHTILIEIYFLSIAYTKNKKLIENKLQTDCGVNWINLIAIGSSESSPFKSFTDILSQKVSNMRLGGARGMLIIIFY